MANLLRAQEVEGGIIFDDGAGVFQDDFDPSVAGGFAAAKGSLFMRNAVPGRLYRKTGDGATDWTEVTAGGVTDFLGLTDTPLSYAGQANKTVKVNPAEDALEFIAETLADFAMVQIRRSTAFTITTTFQDIPFDLTDEENAPAILEHDDVNTDRIDIKETGRYLILYNANISAPQSNNTNDEVRCQVRLNDTTILAGSTADVSVFRDNSVIGAVHDGTAVSGFVRLFTAGDFISLQIDKVESGNSGTTTTEADQVHMTVIRLQGTKGDKGADGSMEVQFSADQLDSPVNADWAVNALAPAAADSNNAGLTVRLFDDTTEEGAGFELEVPSGVITMTVKFRSRAETAPGAVRTVGLKLYNRGIPDNAAVEAWSAGLVLDDIDIPTNEFFQEDEQAITLAALGITAGELTQFELTRIDPTAGTELTGDWVLKHIKLSFT